MAAFLFCLLLITHAFSEPNPNNIYDTYNADECRRIRRPWNALTTDERQLYIDGLLELRRLGHGKVEDDEFIVIASAHTVLPTNKDDAFDKSHHYESDYLFWHGYLVWEVESRIRNLGGKYRCFGMPYWDFTAEYGRPETELPYVYSTGLGGEGDPNDEWRVNGYSWDVTVKEYWAPYLAQWGTLCAAAEDVWPFCSLKRKTFTQSLSAEAAGIEILTRNDYHSFSDWIAQSVANPINTQGGSYDPLWYLLHSAESYFQALWVNCHGYDGINSTNLVNDGTAFYAYCDWGDGSKGYICPGIDLDDVMEFPLLLQSQEWSYINSDDLTIRKLYDLTQWNVMYDTNGDDFYVKSHLEQTCNNTLNEEWFVTPKEPMSNRAELAKTGYSYSVLPSLPLPVIILSVSAMSILVYIIRDWFTDGMVKKELKSGSVSGGYGATL